MTKKTTISLKDFISDTLVQIVEGVVQAQKNKNVKCPPVSKDSVPGLVAPVGGNLQPVSLVHFDVAVAYDVDKEISVKADGKAKGFIGVLSASADLGIEGIRDTSERQENRIKFVVPVRLPGKE